MTFDFDINPDWQERLGRIRFFKRPYRQALVSQGPRILDVTSHGEGRGKQLSPFFLGPCEVPGLGFAKRMENLWQFSKVYPQHIGADGNPNGAWRAWAQAGFQNDRAQRFPMGRGAKPSFLFWHGEKLDYVEAKKKVYFPVYRDLAKARSVFSVVDQAVSEGVSVDIYDFDTYPLDSPATTFYETLNNPNKSTGHGFIVGMMLVYGRDVTPEIIAQMHDEERAVRVTPQNDKKGQHDLFIG